MRANRAYTNPHLGEYGSNKTLKNCTNGMNLEAHGVQHILANIVREVSRRTDVAVRAVNGTRRGPSISDSW